MMGVGGVPNRKPLPGQQYGQPPPMQPQQRQQQQRADVLQGNPDFELPAGGGGFGGGEGGGGAGRLRGNSIPRGNGGQRLPGQIPGMHPAGPGAAAGLRYPGAAF